MTPREIVTTMTARGVRIWVSRDGVIRYRRPHGCTLPDHLRNFPEAVYNRLAALLRCEPQAWWFGRGPTRWHIGVVLSGDVTWSMCGMMPLRSDSLRRELPPPSEQDRLCQCCLERWIDRQLRADLAVTKVYTDQPSRPKL